MCLLGKILCVQNRKVVDLLLPAYNGSHTGSDATACHRFANAVRTIGAKGIYGDEVFLIFHCRLWLMLSCTVGELQPRRDASSVRLCSTTFCLRFSFELEVSPGSTASQPYRGRYCGGNVPLCILLKSFPRKRLCASTVYKSRLPV